MKSGTARQYISCAEQISAHWEAVKPGFKIDALLFAAARKGLAWKASDVDIDPGARFDSGTIPGVLTEFNRLEVGLDKVSGIFSVLRGAE